MIKIVTDSSSYFKKCEALQRSIRIVPLNYTVNGKNYLETYCDHNGDFENLLKSNAEFTTSHPNLAAFLSAFEEELTQGNEVLCITISSRLSGTYGTAFMAAKQTENKKIAVFDSQMAAGGLYLLVCETKKLIESGKTLHEIIKILPKIREKIAIVFSVGDMAPLRKSGRLGFVRMSVGTILNIKPVLLLSDGAIMSDSVTRGNAELIKKLVEKIPEATKEVVVNYIDNSRIASNLYIVIKNKYPDMQIKLQKMGPVLGIHLGLQVVAVSYIV